MPITLYMDPVSPPVRAVLMTAEALGLKLIHKDIFLIKGEQHKPEFLKLNPQHTIPVLDDNGSIIWDSHAINAYLVGKYGKDDSLYPRDLYQRAIVDQRLHFDTGVAFISLILPVRDLKGRGVDKLSENYIAAVYEAYDFLEKFLNGNKWMAGNTVTIADISLLATVSTINELIAIDAEKYPNIQRWFIAGEKLPFYSANKPGLLLAKELLKPLTLNK